ncbi:NAD(P)-dependent oxidoreductase [Cognatazoarcus halotolerans]|uniref:NAD(P)-dependent oxidoreductase n=1 Tax=Cognatazoarcus halotolerans TaxID=2686016 RepID=UPI00135A3A45|nr:NAD(P)-dependent oxidoreductase [Cognatazoarcus halotolerans]MBX3680222.1 NAD(P)-dependent oxidoreductase [Rhodocyclaceae bacterium]MCB1899049.1 NAD(P)-dependent oxidoreductase [Rhodocyclaceae bacterium]MCP5308067.1 NAD(P)-dependent oxidoreductase [Zoogloeaceae bacterium]
MKVGFVGLGAMGRPMAENLLRAGFPVAVWARRAQSAAPLEAAGAVLRPTPAALAADVDVVISMVTGSGDVEALVLGGEGLLAGLRPGAVHVDMSTIAPTTARALAARCSEKGVVFLDAPVSGGVAGAVNGTLAIMVGGDEGALEKVKPVLEAMGKTILRVGPSGAGQVAKACNQMIFVTAEQACAEALRLAAASGVDPARVREALLGGSAWSRALEGWGEKMVRRDFSGGVEARLHHKDFGILMDEAMRLGAPLPIAAQVWQQLDALMSNEWGRKDTSILLRVLERSGGVDSGEERM